MEQKSECKEVRSVYGNSCYLALEVKRRSLRCNIQGTCKRAKSGNESRPHVMGIET